MAVIEFLNQETELAFNRSLIEQHLPVLAPKVAYYKQTLKGKITLITRE